MDIHKNLAYSLVATAPVPAASGTTLVVTAGQGSRFPTAPFNATVWAIGEIPTPSNAEIVRVTSVIGDTLTITRAQEGTSARAVVLGDQIAATVTAKTFTDIETAFAGTASAITNGLLTVNTSGISLNLSAQLTTAALSQDSSKYAGTNGAITGGSITVNTSGVSVNLPAYLTTAGLSQDSSKYAGTNGAITGGSITVNTSGVSVNLPAYLTTAALSNHSHGNPTLNLTNLAGTTASNSAGLTLSLSATAQSVQTQNLHNLTLSGNTAGALAAVSSGTLTLAGGNNITLSQAGNAITISGAAAGGAQTGISGVIVSDATYTSGTVSFSNAGNVTISSSVNGATQFIRLSGNAAQTTQTQNLHNLTISGNTAGALAAVSSGTLTLAGGNNITLSQAGNAITISGANLGGAQTGISGLVVSDATYTSGTVSFSNVGNITISSSVNGATQYVRLSVAAQTVQTQNLHNLTISGNTAGALAAISSGTLTLAGGNNITLSQAGNAITISGANLGGAQTGISGLVVSDTTYTSGTVSFSNQANVTIGSSVNGATQFVRLSVHAPQTGISAVQVSDTTYSSGTLTFQNANGISFGSSGANGISASYTVPTVPAQISAGFSTMGNTSGNTGLVTGRLNLVGGNNITLSGSTNGGSISVTISGANLGGAQTGISGIVASDTTYTSGTVSFSNQANITIGSSANGATQYIRLSGHAAQTVQTQNLHNLTLAGNTAGVMAQVSSGTLTLAGGNNITLSQAGNAITISAAAGAGQSAIEGLGASNTGNTAGNTGVSTGIDFVLAGSNGITISQSTAAGTHTLWVSGTTYQTYDTATTGHPVASANSIGTAPRWAAEDHRHAGIGAIGISTGNTFGTSGSVVGTYWIAGGNNISISQITSNNGSHTLVFSGGAGAAQTGISGIVVSDATYTSGTVSFSNAGNVTISSSVNGATQFIRLSVHAPQTGLSGLQVSNTTYTSGTVTFQNANGISFGSSGANGISASYTVPTITNSSWTVSDAATSGTVGRLAFTNLNGVTLSLSTGAAGSHTIVGSHNALTSQSTQFLALTLGGNSAGTSTFHATNNVSLFLNGGNNITLSGNGSTVTISAAAQSNQQLTLFATGNTTQSSTGTSNASSLIFAGSGIASVGITNGSVLISVPSGGGGLTNIRVSGGTTSNLLSDITFTNANGVSFQLNGSTMSASVNTVGTATTVYPVATANSVGTVTRWAAEDHRHAGQTAMDFFDNAPVGASTQSNPGQMTLYVFPFTPINEVFPAPMTASTVMLNVTQSLSTAATFTNQVSLAFYTSVNSTQLTRVFSGSTSWGTNAGNMSINDSFGGTRWLSIHSSNFDVAPTFAQGVHYWCALWHRTSNNAGSMSFNFCGFASLGNSAARSGIMGLASVNNSSRGWVRFNGIYSATFSSAMPAALAASDINKSVAQVAFFPQVILNNIGSDIV